MVDLLSALFESFRQRLTNPLLGAYASIWSVFNWKILYYFFMADFDVITKINHISTVYQEPYFLEINGAWMNFLIPLIFAVLFVLGFPWVQLKIQELQNIPTKKRLDITADLEEARLRSFQEVETLKAEQRYAYELIELQAQGKLEDKRKAVAEKTAAAEKSEEKIASAKKKVNISTVRAVRSPPEVKEFQTKYKLLQLNKSRLSGLMDFLDFELNYKRFTKFIPKEESLRNHFAARVQHIDEVLKKVAPDYKKIPFKTIEDIIFFQLTNKYPNSNPEWENVLVFAGPDYTSIKMSSVMDKDARGISH